MGGGCDFMFPEGIDGQTIIANCGYSSIYSVPQGKRLYVLSKPIAAELIINGKAFNSALLARPMILNSGDQLSSSWQNCYFNGILVEESASVSAITADCSTSSTYSVPVGKKLYVLSIYNSTITASTSSTAFEQPSGAFPLIFNSGVQLSTGGTYGAFNGYLVDENYFANCGGGGSSSSGSNQSLSVSLNGDSLFISDGNFVLVPGISSTNYTKADFSANYTTVTITNPVSFTDLSTASPISWHWDFGDGNTSTQQHPTHTYNNVGTYTVTLIATDANVSDTIVKTNYINATLDVGGYYQGGIVFYLDGNGGGLICALQELPNAHQWGCYNTALSGAGGLNIGDGLQNTIDIVNGCSQSGIAAEECYNLTENGYSDWFLPSKLELEEMRNQMLIIDSASVIYGGVLFMQSGTYYWSSTQASSSGAWEYDFQTPSWTNNVNKDHPQRVRPIREF